MWTKRLIGIFFVVAGGALAFHAFQDNKLFLGFMALMLCLIGCITFAYAGNTGAAQTGPSDRDNWIGGNGPDGGQSGCDGGGADGGAGGCGDGGGN